MNPLSSPSMTAQAPLASRRLLMIIFALWSVALILSGYQPKDRLTWWMEVAPVFIGGAILHWTWEKFPFPRFVVLWIFFHGLVLILGGHYTYAEVPLGYWVQSAFDLSRNHYDRLGHLMQGFVPALITRLLLVRKVKIDSRPWAFFLTVTVCMALSVTYEFIEWWAALILGQGSDAFLGTQGDVWDTQWDMFLATVGAILAQVLYGKKLR